MVRSIASQVEALQRAVANRAAPETVVQVDLVCADDRAQALALLALPPTPAPDAARVRLSAIHHMASDYLAGKSGPALSESET